MTGLPCTVLYFMCVTSWYSAPFHPSPRRALLPSASSNTFACPTQIRRLTEAMYQERVPVASVADIHGVTPETCIIADMTPGPSRCVSHEREYGLLLEKGRP